VRVEEFGLGFPPRAFGKKIGETIYSINWLPFGGFVRLTGEDDPSASPRLKDKKNFQVKGPLVRLYIILAGVVMNILLAFLLYYLLLFVKDFESQPMLLIKDFSFKYGRTHHINTVITGIEEDSSASQSGLAFGDAIYMIESEAELVNVSEASEIQNFLKDKSEQDLKIYVRNIDTKEERVLPVTPKYNDELQRSVIGVLISKVVVLNYETSRERLFSGPMHSYNMVSYSMSGLSDLFKESFREKDIRPVSESVSGPVGIYGLVSDIVEIGGNEAFLELINLVAIFSLSLATLNILPFPALDGGRGAFILLEMIMRKKINPKFEVALHQFGMLALLALLFAITFSDIRDIIR